MLVRLWTFTCFVKLTTSVKFLCISLTSSNTYIILYLFLWNLMFLFSSFSLIWQETWRQHVTGGKLREITEDAKAYAIGNKALAALFVHTPAGELQRQIRSWLAENFEFLSVTGGDPTGGTTGQLELLSTAIMDGWMAGLGFAQPPNTDALGQLLSEYAKRVYTSQLQHLKVCNLEMLPCFPPSIYTSYQMFPLTLLSVNQCCYLLTLCGNIFWIFVIDLVSIRIISSVLLSSF